MKEIWPNTPDQDIFSFIKNIAEATSPEALRNPENALMLHQLITYLNKPPKPQTDNDKLEKFDKTLKPIIRVLFFSSELNEPDIEKDYQSSFSREKILAIYSTPPPSADLSAAQIPLEIKPLTDAIWPRRTAIEIKNFISLLVNAKSSEQLIKAPNQQPLLIELSTYLNGRLPPPTTGGGISQQQLLATQIYLLKETLSPMITPLSLNPKNLSGEAYYAEYFHNDKIQFIYNPY